MEFVEDRKVLQEFEILVCPEDKIKVTCICSCVVIRDPIYDSFPPYEENELEDFEDRSNSTTTDEVENQGSEEDQNHATSLTHEKQYNSDSEYIVLDESAAMSALGLPTEFGKKSRRTHKAKSRINKETFEKYVLPSIEASNQVQRALDHTILSVEPIFQKLGYFYENNDNKPEESIIQKDDKENINEIITIETSCSSDDSNSNDSDTRTDDDETDSEKDGTIEKSTDKKNGKKSIIPKEIQKDKKLMKYWLKRYTLFSLYDQGIKLDREAWFSATPEKIAIHTANRLRCDTIVDAFCGTGGNTIQFAKTCKKVIAIDIDPKKIKMAKHNAKIYGVTDNIEFIVGDFLQLYSSLKANVVFLSPPWGGPNYKKKTPVYDVEMHLLPLPASDLMKICHTITKNIAMYLPKNSNSKQLIQLAGAGNAVELEQHRLFGRFTAITALYGDLVKT